MPHLHLSLQSGDDMILKRMKRRHCRADAIRFCEEVRALRPGHRVRRRPHRRLPDRDRGDVRELAAHRRRMRPDPSARLSRSRRARARRPRACRRCARAIVKERAARLRAAGDAAYARPSRLRWSGTTAVGAGRARRASAAPKASRRSRSAAAQPGEIVAGRDHRPRRRAAAGRAARRRKGGLTTDGDRFHQEGVFFGAAAEAEPVAAESRRARPTTADDAPAEAARIDAESPQPADTVAAGAAPTAAARARSAGPKLVAGSSACKRRACRARRTRADRQHRRASSPSGSSTRRRCEELEDVLIQADLGVETATRDHRGAVGRGRFDTEYRAATRYARSWPPRSSKVLAPVAQPLEHRPGAQAACHPRGRRQRHRQDHDDRQAGGQAHAPAG